MAMDQPRPIGERIRSAREERELSVKELADKAGCLDEYLEWVEDGQQALCDWIPVSFSTRTSLRTAV